MCDEDGMEAAPDPARVDADGYPRTSWTTVIDALLVGGREHRDLVWRRFLASYRQPIVATVRARLRAIGRESQTEEMVDRFVSYLGTGSVIATADRALGRLRCYLQVAIRHFVHQEIRTDEKAPTKDLELDELIDVVQVERDDRAWFCGLVCEEIDRLAGVQPDWAEAIAMRFGIETTLFAPGAAQKPAAIAAQLGVSRSTVHNRLYDAKRRLRRALGPALDGTIYSVEATEHEAIYRAERDLMRHCVDETWPNILVDEIDD